MALRNQLLAAAAGQVAAGPTGPRYEPVPSPGQVKGYRRRYTGMGTTGGGPAGAGT